MFFYTVNGNLETFSNLSIPCDGNCKNTIDEINIKLAKKDVLQNNINDLQSNISFKDEKQRNDELIISNVNKLNIIKNELDKKNVFDSVKKFEKNYKNKKYKDIDNVKNDLLNLLKDLNKYNVDTKQELIIKKKIKELMMILDNMKIELINNQRYIDRKNNCKN